MKNSATTLASRTSQLVALAIRGLESMYDSEKRLFCHRVCKTPQGLKQEGISHRYTIMTLLGVLEAQSAGWRHSTDLEATTDQLFSDTAWVTSVGDLGLLLWLCATLSEKRLQQFYSKFELSQALERYPDARRRLTMELSWFLTGLAQAYKAEQRSDLLSLASEVFERLQANQGQHGLFGHMAVWSSIRGLVRGRVGSFADQVYPIVALSHFAEVANSAEARESAFRCASAICARQGSMGQWWWHYDALSGRIVEHYPVYSVHQHGMAPMALNAIQKVGQSDFQASIDNGLKWIDGANELRESLEDAEAGIIWRCIRLPKPSSYAARLRTLVDKQAFSGSFHMLYECRPYELGWLLYALAPSTPALSTN